MILNIYSANMVYIHYNTKESFDMKSISDKMVADNSFERINNSYKNLPYCPKRVVIDDFPNFKLPEWFLMKLITECEELHIFIKYEKIFISISNIRFYRNLDRYAKILGVEFKYINEYLIYKKENPSQDSKINKKNLNFSELLTFDLRKFFDNNIEDITNLSLTYNHNEYASHIDFDVILSKNRYRRVLFIRQLLVYLLYKSNFSSVLIGKMLQRDHSTILSARDFFMDFVYIYFTEKDKEKLNQLRQKLLSQLTNNNT
jgi:hypothetical protein